MEKRDITIEGYNIVLYTDDLVWGDGNHPSTLNCIRLLKGLDLVGKKVLDIGTGTGIQSILSQRFGSKEICGIDINPSATGLAELNFRKNDVIGTLHTILPGEIINYKADVIVANLPPDMCEWYLGKMERYMTDDSKVIMSMPTRFDMEVALNNSKCKLHVTKEHVDNGYGAFLLESEI